MKRYACLLVALLSCQLCLAQEPSLYALTLPIKPRVCLQPDRPESRLCIREEAYDRLFLLVRR